MIMLRVYTAWSAAIGDLKEGVEHPREGLSRNDRKLTFASFGSLSV